MPSATRQKTWMLARASFTLLSQASYAAVTFIPLTFYAGQVDYEKIRIPRAGVSFHTAVGPNPTAGHDVDGN